MKFWNQLQKTVSGICLNIGASVCHIFLSKCVKNNSKTARTLETLKNFISCTFFMIYITEVFYTKHNCAVAILYKY
jgi:inner membrane protein involved in colicin E2 resistance